MCVFLISPVPITEPLTSELIDTPVFYNLAPRPIKYRVSVPIPNTKSTIMREGRNNSGEVRPVILSINQCVTERLVLFTFEV